MFRKLLGRCFDFLLGLATPVPPRAAIGLVQRELAGLCGVGPDQGEIGRRNKRSIVACEFEPDHLAACAVAHIEGLQTIKQSQATLEMNDGRAALGNIRVIEAACPDFGHRLRMMGAAAEHVRRGHHQGSAFCLMRQSRRRSRPTARPCVLPASAASSQLAKRSALTPLMRSIARRSSSTAATKSKRDPALSASAT